MRRTRAAGLGVVAVSSRSCILSYLTIYKKAHTVLGRGVCGLSELLMRLGGHHHRVGIIHERMGFDVSHDWRSAASFGASSQIDAD